SRPAAHHPDRLPRHCTAQRARRLGLHQTAHSGRHRLVGRGGRAQARQAGPPEAALPAQAQGTHRGSPGITMYKSFFHLDSTPFADSPDPRFLVRMAHTREALATLEYGIGAHKGFIVLTGEVGTGKTTLL